MQAKQVDQVVGEAVQQQAEGVSQKAMTAQAVGAKTVFEFLDAVLAFAAIVVEGEDFGGSRARLVITKRRLVPVVVCSAL